MTVYLLHIDPPLEHARHYIGFCEDGRNDLRLAEHIAGRGARILAAAARAGRKITLVHTWPGASRAFERKLKNRKAAPRWCPCCKPDRHGKRPLPRWDGAA